MSFKTDETGHRQPLFKRLFKLFAATTVAVSLLTGGGGLVAPGAVEAAGETRTLSMYHTHTKERIQITYKVNGRYVPSALKKINYFLRDWRRNESTRMDPKTLDLVWELHTDLGSRQPVHIVSAYRSAKTNGFLRRIGRKVAKKSQHIKGKAMDIYFPDVSSEKIRNSALVRQVGGVGYYRRGGGPTGFVHVDSGNVRHWPRIAPSKLAKIFRDNRKTIGRRLNRKDQIMIASAEAKKELKQIQAATAQGQDFDEDISEEPAEAAIQAAKKPAPEAEKPAAAEAAPAEAMIMASASDVPVPRDKPIEILYAAANVTPTAAVPEKQMPVKTRPVKDSLGVVDGAESMTEEPQFETATNKSAKGSFGDGVKKPKVVQASAGEDVFGLAPKKKKTRKAEAERDELASLAEEIAETPAPRKARRKEPGVQKPESSGKGDLLVVNRAAKGGLMIGEPKRQKIGQLRLDNLEPQ